MNFDQLVNRIRRMNAPKPLAKALPQIGVMKKRRPTQVVLAKSAPDTPPMSVDEAKRRLSDACVRGNMSGQDAWQMEQAITSHGAVPDDVATFLRGVS